MFHKLKQYKDLRSQAKDMQSALAQETVSIDKNGIKLVMNGNMEIVSLSLPEMDKTQLEKTLPDVINEGNKKIQRLMADKMQAMGGLPGMGM